LVSSQTIKQILDVCKSDYIILLTRETLIDNNQFSIERFIQVAEDTGSGMIYSDYMEKKENVLTPHPVIDYQFGSLRDDFNFGVILFLNTNIAKKYFYSYKSDYKFAGIYDLRLKISQYQLPVRIPEFLYTAIETDIRKSGQKLFDYVDPRNRAVQIEMEEAVTEHLKAVNGYLKPDFKYVNFDEYKFETVASVIIPVKNRVKTIGDAIESVIKQNPDFSFNLFVVDNYSTDGTTEIIKKYAEKDKRIIHLIPERKDLGIGGCWNEAVHHYECGMFSVQLDSDDIFKDEHTIQKIVDTFRKEKTGMVVGTYQMTNFELQEIPPGIIDHKEWTPDNGRNNALRINGLGAPRAFFTPLLRNIKIPNVSYGEDYAVGLSISRHYQIGRLYEPIYLCRRWDGNSDSSLDIVKENNHNTYKDRIRTIELMARQNYNKKK